MQLTHERHHEKALFLVAVERSEALLEYVVADVVIAGLANRADAVDRLVDSVASAEGVLPRWVGLVAEEDPALHSSWPRHAGSPECRRGQVEQADDIAVFGTRLVLRRRRDVLRPLDDQ